MATLDLTLTNAEITLSVQAVAALPDGGLAQSHVYSRVITTLIEEADTDFWEKDPQELQAEEFYADILEALTRHYAVSIDSNTEPLRAHEWLAHLLTNLQKQGRLQELLPHSSDEGFDMDEAAGGI